MWLSRQQQPGSRDRHSVLLSSEVCTQDTLAYTLLTPLFKIVFFNWGYVLFTIKTLSSKIMIDKNYTNTKLKIQSKEDTQFWLKSNTRNSEVRHDAKYLIYVTFLIKINLKQIYFVLTQRCSYDTGEPYS